MADSDKGTVLVVDDEPTILDVVSRYMERAGYETHQAADGPEALRLVEQHRPDLVVLDLMLPGIDGIEVMRRLYEQSGPRIAVILLTARGEESDRLVGLRQGADDYVVKPFSPAELVARVEAVLRRVLPPDEEAPPIEHGPLRIERAGVRSIRFHDLRHTFGTRMAAAGAPLRTIQEWMGHRDYKTTEIYADYAPDPVQGARWAEAAFSDEEDEEDDGDATDDENEAS